VVNANVLHLYLYSLELRALLLSSHRHTPPDVQIYRFLKKGGGVNYNCLGWRETMNDLVMLVEQPNISSIEKYMLLRRKENIPI